VKSKVLADIGRLDFNNGAAEAPVGVVVVNHNLPAETLRCVRGVLAGTVRPMSVVVVDNGSRPEVLRALSDLPAGVEVVALGENLGFAAASNRGIGRVLRRDLRWVWLLNNDVVPEQDSLEILLQVGEGLPKAGILSPLVRRLSDGRVWHQGAREGGRFGLLPEGLATASGEAVAVDYVSGCAMLVRRDLFEAVGPLDEGFFAYYEELDFCCRARAAGFSIFVIPSAIVWHEVGATGRLLPTQTRFHRARSRIRFYRRYGAPRLLVLPLVIASTLVWSGRCLLEADLAGASATLAGLWAGLRADLRPSYGIWPTTGNL